MLLTALHEGDVAIDEARAIVARAHALLAAVEAEVGTGEDAVMQRARQALRDDAPTPQTREVTRAATAYLARHFHR